MRDQPGAISTSPMPPLRPLSPFFRTSSSPPRHLKTAIRLYSSPAPEQPSGKPAPILQRPVPSTGPRPRDQLSVWPFVFIFALGSGLFAWTVKSREGVTPKPASHKTLPAPPPRKREKQEQD
ncbi:hypothetical protein MRB53_037662 [Persea americana]|nr:hypothetical protein MRB53_037662 [Persea americana]